MNRLWRRCSVMLFCLANLIAASQLCRAEQLAPGDRLFPKETLVFFTIANVTEFKKKWENSSTGQLLREPQLKPFLEDAYKRIGDELKVFEEQIGVSVSNILELPRGQLTFAFMERPRSKYSLVTVIEYGDQQQNVDKFLKEFDDALEKQDFEHSTEEIEKTQVQVYSHKKDMSNNPFKTVAYFTDKSSLVISTELAGIKEVLNRWDGTSDNVLAENDKYKYIQAQCKTDSDDPLIKTFANPIGLVHSAISMIPQAGLAAPLIIPMIGIDGMKGWGGAMDFDEGDFDGVSNFFVYNENPKGLFGFFLFPSIQLTPSPWIPANVAWYAIANWDLEAAYKSVESFYDNFQVAGATSRYLEKLAEHEPGIHIKKDVLDYLDGKIQFFQSERKASNDDDAQMPVFLVGLGLKDAPKMKKTMAAAAKSGDSNTETREFNGETIYEATQDEGEPFFSAAVTDGTLVATNNPQQLEGVIRNQSERGSSLAESAEYKRVAKFFPSKTSMLSFQNNEMQMKMYYDLAKSVDSDAIEGIDFSKLPPFEVIAKYLAPSGGYIVADKKGCKWVSFSLKRAD